MKRTAWVFLGMVLGLSLLVGVAQAAEKYGYVDLSTIFSEYSKTKNYDKVLSEKESSYNSEREKKISEVKQFQDKMNLLSDKEKEAKKSEMDSKLKALQEFDRQRQLDLRKDFNDKKSEILKDIDNTIKQYAEKEGYTLIFNEAGVVYNIKNLDITAKILDLLNKNSGK